MAIEVTCQGCGARLNVSDEHAGKMARCPTCEKLTAIPATPFRQDDAASAEPKREAADSGGSGYGTTADDPSMAWYMKVPEGAVYGPATRRELDQWHEEGRIARDCLLRCEPNEEWMPAGKVYSDLGGGKLAARYDRASGRVNREQTPLLGTRDPDYDVPHRAPLLLCFSLAAWMTYCFPISLYVLAATRHDLAEMEQHRMDPSGESITRIARIIAIIQLCTMVVVLPLTILWFVAFLAQLG